MFLAGGVTDREAVRGLTSIGSAEVRAVQETFEDSLHTGELFLAIACRLNGRTRLNGGMG